MSSYFGRPDYVHAADQEYERARGARERLDGWLALADAVLADTHTQEDD
jgi:hypothetical protein